MFPQQLKASAIVWILILFGKDKVNFEVNIIKFPLQITLLADGLIGMDFLLQFKNIKFNFDEKTIET